MEDLRQKEKLLRLYRKADARRLLPASPIQCSAQVRIYIGQSIVGGTWVRCSKRPRPGKLCCHWHRKWEDDENEPTTPSAGDRK